MKYDLILAQNHDNPGLLATMGTLYTQMGKYGLAISLLRRAVKLTPQSDFWCNLACAYKKSGQPDKADECFKKAVAHKPTAAALGNYSSMFVNNGTPDKAIELCKKSIKIDPNSHAAHWNMALALLEKGEWATAWEEHEWGFQSGQRIDRKIANAPYWDGTNGKTIVVYGEQGLGDEIMFATMLPELMKNNTVIFECHSRMKHLFEEAFPGLLCYGTREDTELTWHNYHKIDYRVSIGSLGKWFRTSKDSFPGTPYLKAKAVPRGTKFRVGISWTGGLKANRVAARTVPLSMWGSILEQDCEFVSLQYTECKAEIENMAVLGHKIEQDDRVYADDYYETAELVKSCDLVISCCTSVIHLAGGLGVPCWVMVPNKPAWRYGVTGKMPWYRSVRLYRQPAGGQETWLPVIEKIALDLKEKIECNSSTPNQNIVNTVGMCSLAESQ